MQEQNEHRDKFSVSRLEKLTYRSLQQQAKALHLPSNYKKKYLIQLINAKYFGTQVQVDSIIQHVVRERQELQLVQSHVSRTRKLQAAEVSSTSESTLQSPPMSMSRTMTPVIVRYSPKVRRVFKQEFHKPQVLAKPQEVFGLNDHGYNAKKTFASTSQASCSSQTSYEPVPGTSYKIKRTAPKTCRTSFKSHNTDKPYRPSTTIAAVKNYLMQRPETGRVLRNRTYSTVNRYKTEKYKDDTETLYKTGKYKDDTETPNDTESGRYNERDDIIPVRYEVVTSNLNPLPEKYKGNPPNVKRTLPIIYIDGSGQNNKPPKRYKTDEDGKYRSNVKTNPLQPMKSPVRDELKMFRPSKSSGGQVALVPTGQSLIKHRPAILGNDTAKLVQRSVGRAKVIRKLDDTFDSLKGTHINTEPLQPTPEPTSAKRQRTLSGIYPIDPAECKPNIDYHYVQSGMGIRKADGTFSKINALIRKPLQKSVTTNTPLKTYRSPKQLHAEYQVMDEEAQKPVDCKIQEVIAKIVSTAYNIEKHVETPLEVTIYSQTVQNYTTTEPNYTTASSREKENNNNNNYFTDDYTTYCHKKIRSEQVRSRRESLISRKEMQNEHLPRIHEVFSSFSNVQVTEPIFVQAGGETPSYTFYPQGPLAPAQQQGAMLETLYNFRALLVTHAPLAAVTTTATYCVYTTPLVTTAKAQTSKFAPNAQYNSLLNYKSESLAKDYPNLSFSYSQKESSHSTTGSLEALASQAGDKTWNSSSTVSLDTAGSIPDMVEDALELISQDGDYMERIEMDEGIQCVLCIWAGSKIFLEDHIRQAHPEAITTMWSRHCDVTYHVVDLSRGVTRVLEKGTRLLVLRAAIAGGWLQATLHSLYSDEDAFEVATLSAYNKRNGEQYSWTGLVPALAPMYTLEPDLESDTHRGLQVRLSDLGLTYFKPKNSYQRNAV